MAQHTRLSMPLPAPPHVHTVSPAPVLTSPTMQSLSDALPERPMRSTPTPDMDVFTSLTDIKPGNIPLLVRMPNNNYEQVEVPLNSNLDDLAAVLGKGMHGTSGEELRFSFGNHDLPQGASLLDTNVVDAYEHAGSLLNIIDGSELDVTSKAAALNSACAVVESISNGVKDMEALCNAAMENAPSHPLPTVPPSPRTAGIVAAGAAEAERDTPKEIDGGEFKELNSILSRPIRDPTEPDSAPAASPVELARSLSRHLPLLFPASPATAALSPDVHHLDDQSASQRHGHVARVASSIPPESQPSLASIREARLRAREAQAIAPPKPPPDAEKNAANAISIGGSTFGTPLPLHLPGQEGASQRGSGNSGRESSTVMAAKAKSTWLEDVMKTWEVKYIRQSGVLERSKEGQQISEYFNGLDAEAQRELETAHIEDQRLETENNAGTATGSAGDSEDEDEEDANTQFEGTTSNGQPELTARSAVTDSEDRTQLKDRENGLHDIRKSIANFGLSESVPHDKTLASQMMNAQSAASAALCLSNSPQSSQHVPLARAPQTPSSATMSAASTPLCNGRQNDNGSSLDAIQPTGTRPSVKIRQAKRIAPAPNMEGALSPGIAGVVSNGIFPYPGGMAPAGVWPQSSSAPVPKKRGRKRKNPELSEEERALVRKEQNRESAKLSRVRRKVIAAEYEGRLSTLVGENTMLRKQVEGLNNRLVYLQSLLTISVRQEPSAGGRR